MDLATRVVLEEQKWLYLEYTWLCCHTISSLTDGVQKDVSRLLTIIHPTLTMCYNDSSIKLCEHEANRVAEAVINFLTSVLSSSFINSNVWSEDFIEKLLQILKNITEMSWIKFEHLFVNIFNNFVILKKAYYIWNRRKVSPVCLPSPFELDWDKNDKITRLEIRWNQALTFSEQLTLIDQWVNRLYISDHRLQPQECLQITDGSNKFIFYMWEKSGLFYYAIRETRANTNSLVSEKKKNCRRFAEDELLSENFQKKIGDYWNRFKWDAMVLLVFNGKIREWFSSEDSVNSLLDSMWSNTHENNETFNIVYKASDLLINIYIDFINFIRNNKHWLHENFFNFSIIYDFHIAVNYSSESDLYYVKIFD